MDNQSAAATDNDFATSADEAICSQETVAFTVCDENVIIGYILFFVTKQTAFNGKQSSSEPIILIAFRIRLHARIDG